MHNRRLDFLIMHSRSRIKSPLRRYDRNYAALAEAKGKDSRLCLLSP